MHYTAQITLKILFRKVLTYGFDPCYIMNVPRSNTAHPREQRTPRFTPRFKPRNTQRKARHEQRKKEATASSIATKF